MASKSVICSYCGMHILVPPFTNATQCAVCQTIIRPQHDDPFGQTHNSIFNATNRPKDISHTATNNINMMVSRTNNYSRSGTSGFEYYPQQPKPSGSLIPLSAHGRKRAVLCGVSYYGQRYKLNGTVNDVKCMRQFLIQRFGFPSDCILILTEAESDPSLIPTKSNIRKALKWLVQGCQSGDSLVFHYSGHGSQQLDLDGDEVDGYDEILWPVDYQSEGAIVDDEINATIVRPLPTGAKLHAIIDACHSGTILDLPFVCRINREGYYKWVDHSLPHAAYKGTSGGYAISISACDDHQESGDTTAFTGTAAGALTYSFVKALEQEPRLNYGTLLMAMSKGIGTARKEVGLRSEESHLAQDPQLSSSHKFDIHSKPFTL